MLDVNNTYRNAAISLMENPTQKVKSDLGDPSGIPTQVSSFEAEIVETRQLYTQQLGSHIKSPGLTGPRIIHHPKQLNEVISTVLDQ